MSHITNKRIEKKEIPIVGFENELKNGKTSLSYSSMDDVGDFSIIKSQGLVRISDLMKSLDTRIKSKKAILKTLDKRDLDEILEELKIESEILAIIQLKNDLIGDWFE